MKYRHLLFTLLAGLAFTTPALASELKIGLQEDLDFLDADQSRSYIARVVLTALCDKLVDFSPDLKVVPQLATRWAWSADGKVLTMDLRQGVKFHDETPFNAQAVVANIDRSQHLKESKRKSELASVDHVEAVGDYQVKFVLKHPDATLLAQLGDRAGMMKSPAALQSEGLKFSSNPVCSGPFKFVSRVPQDRTVLEKFKDYWNASNIFIDKLTYRPIPDTTVRLANLRSGDIDMLERLSPTNLDEAKHDPNLVVQSAVGVGHQSIRFNIAHGPLANTAFAKSKLVRQAFSWSIDRKALNQVVFGGAYAPGNQPFPPNSPWYDKDFPVPDRDIDKAKALMKQAGFDHVDATMSIPNDPQGLQAGQVLQSMAAEAGINLKLQATEYATLLSMNTSGNYQISYIAWSGRADPDGNTYSFMVCGGDLNDGGYCNPEMDKLLNAARASTDEATRKKDYDAAEAIIQDDEPLLYVFHQTWIWAMRKNVTGFVPSPDGMIRLVGMKKG